MILCCGEALIDMLPRTTQAGEDCYMPDPGGAVHNTAVALGRLGADVGFVSGISTDFFGQMLMEKLEGSGVNTADVVRADRPTTMAYVKLTNGHATYVFYDENTAGRMLEPEDMPHTRADAYFFGGISLVVDPCGAAYAAMMQRVAPDAITMIDPNIRPGFITDEAAYRARISAMLKVANIVKTSDEDLDWIGGGVEGLLEDTATSVVLLTKGSEGVTIITREGQWDVPAQKATVVDTVGAGDTFNAGFLAGLDQAGFLTKSTFPDVTEQALHAAATLGAKAAAVTVSRAGVNPPWAREL